MYIHLIFYDFENAQFVPPRPGSSHHSPIQIRKQMKRLQLQLRKQQHLTRKQIIHISL